MAWLPALITGCAALLAGLFVALLNHRSVQSLAEKKNAVDKELAQQQAEQQERLKQLETSLAENLAESTAKREYEYDALKRLYISARPLMFKIGELCEDSNRRIDRLFLGSIRLDSDHHASNDRISDCGAIGYSEGAPSAVDNSRSKA